MTNATGAASRRIWIALAIALSVALGISFGLTAPTAAAEPIAIDLVADAAQADGVVVKEGTEVVSQVRVDDGIELSLVSYESNIGPCLAGFAAEATTGEYLGMVGSCGFDPLNGFESSWTVGTLTAESKVVGIAFGMAESGVDSVLVGLSDGVSETAVISSGTWLAVFDASDERAVSKIAAMTDAGALAGEVAIESRPDPVRVEEHDH